MSPPWNLFSSTPEEAGSSPLGITNRCGRELLALKSKALAGRCHPVSDSAQTNSSKYLHVTP
jgi:hypothetical protein